MSLQTLKDKAVKRMGTGMKSVVKEKALQIIEKAYKEGIYVLITDGYRSHAEQDALYAQGRTTSGPIVTNAKGGQSNHNFGIAIDFCLTNKEGTTADYTVGTKWMRVVAIAKSLGFAWGGNWKSFPDRPHLEYTGKVTSSAPTPSTKNYVEKGDRGDKVESLQVALNKVGYKLVVDEIFGTATEKAVRDFQAKHGLAVDGVAGVKTFAKLDEVTKKNSSAGIKSVGKIKVTDVKNFTYIYAKASDTSEKIAEAHKNSTYDIAGSVKGWYEVIYKGKRRYIKSKYCSKI